MKIVIKLDLHDNKEKQKAMKAVSRLSGAINMKEGKLSVVGGVDPVDVVNKLRKFWHTEIVSVGPEKEPEKEEPKKEVVEKKVAEPKKTAESEKKKDPGEQQVSDLVRVYQAYSPHMTTHY